MAINTHYTSEQRSLLARIEKARNIGVDVGNECALLYEAIITGLTYTGFNGIAIPIDDERCIRASDHLFDRAYEQGKWLEYRTAIGYKD